MTSLLARGTAIAAGALALLVTVIGGAVTPGHSHAANYISELGARGEPYGELVSLAGFLPIGVLSLVALLASAGLQTNRGLRASVWWMLTLPLAYVAAAFARCAPGCAGVDGMQAIHNLAGLGEYLGGAIALGVAGTALLRAGRSLAGVLCWLLAGVVLACLYAIGLPELAFRGAAQRVAEVVLFGYVIFLAWQPQARNQDPVIGSEIRR